MLILLTNNISQNSDNVNEDTQEENVSHIVVQIDNNLPYSNSPIQRPNVVIPSIGIPPRFIPPVLGSYSTREYGNRNHIGTSSAGYI